MGTTVTSRLRTFSETFNMQDEKLSQWGMLKVLVIGERRVEWSVRNLK